MIEYNQEGLSALSISDLISLKKYLEDQHDQLNSELCFTLALECIDQERVVSEELNKRLRNIFIY